MTGQHLGAHDAGQSERSVPVLVLVALGTGVGVLAAAGSIVFGQAIGLVQSVLFYGRVTDAPALHAYLPPSPWGAWIILVPAIGALGVTWITRRLSPEVRGSGVPEVLYAIYYHGGRIRLNVAASRVAAAALSIGSGASVGREGPIVHIGAILGAGIGAVANLLPFQRVVLVAAGAGAGIAATFDAPLGGLAFAIELLLISVTARNVAIVATAVLVATWLSGLIGGFGAVFPLPELARLVGGWVTLDELLLALPFGVLVGLVAAGFEETTERVGDIAGRITGNAYLRHGVAMLLVGAMIYAFLVYSGQYHVAGIGYPTMENVLRGVLANPGFLLLLFAAKFAAATLALGTGASGGVFAPGLFLGATLGAAYAHAVGAIAPVLVPEPALFALAGMAGMVGATTGAVVTAMVMVLELGEHYAGVLPIVLTTAVAFMVRRQIEAESMYTLRLVRRGQRIPKGLEAAHANALETSGFMSRDFEIIERGRLDAGDQEPHARYAVITDGGIVIGLLPRQAVTTADARSDAIDHRIARLTPGTRWPEIMRTLKANGDHPLIVADGPAPQDVQGVITIHEVANAARDAGALYD